MRLTPRYDSKLPKFCEFSPHFMATTFCVSRYISRPWHTHTVYVMCSAGQNLKWKIPSISFCRSNYLKELCHLFLRKANSFSSGLSVCKDLDQASKEWEAGCVCSEWQWNEKFDVFSRYHELCSAPFQRLWNPRCLGTQRFRIQKQLAQYWQSSATRFEIFHSFSKVNHHFMNDKKLLSKAF